jgi:hypothetical protein
MTSISYHSVSANRLICFILDSFLEVLSPYRYMLASFTFICLFLSVFLLIVIILIILCYIVLYLSLWRRFLRRVCGQWGN